MADAASYRAVGVAMALTGVGALVPVTTIFFGWLGLDEVLTPVQLLRAALVLSGVALVSVKRGKPASPLH